MDTMDSTIQGQLEDADQFGGQADYFGYFEREQFYLPDGKSFFVLQALNEGDKSKFQKMTQRDMVVEKASGNARFRIDPSTERHELIKACVKDWNLRRGAEALPFNDRNLTQFLTLADPRIVEKIEAKIRKMNPWLAADLSVEEIEEQIKELEDMRRQKLEQEAGEDSSASK